MCGCLYIYISFIFHLLRYITHILYNANIKFIAHCSEGYIQPYNHFHLNIYNIFTSLKGPCNPFQQITPCSATTEPFSPWINQLFLFLLKKKSHTKCTLLYLTSFSIMFQGFIYYVVCINIHSFLLHCISLYGYTVACPFTYITLLNKNINLLYTLSPIFHYFLRRIFFFWNNLILQVKLHVWSIMNHFQIWKCYSYKDALKTMIQ